jgi:hypothetical protein
MSTNRNGWINKKNPSLNQARGEWEKSTCFFSSRVTQDATRCQIPPCQTPYGVTS